MEVGEISDKTKSEYIKITKSIIRGEKSKDAVFEKIIEKLNSTKSVSYWYKIKASVVFCFKENIARGKVVDDFKDILNRVGQLEPPAISMRKKRHSKKKDLKKYQCDWREQIIKHTPKYEKEVLTLALCGCRPIELKNGVDWNIIGDDLKVSIRGAKVTSYSGQEERSFVIKNDNHLTIKLYAIVKENEGHLLIQMPGKDYKNVSNAISSTSKRLFKFKKGHVSAYSFRHYFGTQQKLNSQEGRLDSLSASAALGHAVENTKNVYGDLRLSGAKGGLITQVKASREVKPNATDYKKLTKKTDKKLSIK